MESKESKYNKPIEKGLSRQQKNQELYEEISNKSLDKFDVNSNSTIIGANNTNQIDVEKIKKILDMKYNEVPKRKSINIERNYEEKPDLESTKEYDINAFINKAKSEIIVNYDDEKVKKPNKEQYDILKNLNLSLDEEELVKEKNNDFITVKKDEPKELLDLINTIVINENKLKDENTEVALDLFDDLKATDGEKTIEESDNESRKARKDLSKTEIKIEKIDIKEELEKRLKESKNEEKIFETKETKFKKSDFESLMEDDEETSDIFLKLFIFIIVISFIIGMYYFLTSFMNF